MVEVELRREQVWRSERESGAWLALGWAPGSTGQAFLLYTRTAAPPPPPPSSFILTHTLTDPPHPAPILGLYRVTPDNTAAAHTINCWHIF